MVELLSIPQTNRWRSMNQHIKATIEKEIVCKYFVRRIDEKKQQQQQ